MKKLHKNTIRSLAGCLIRSKVEIIQWFQKIFTKLLVVVKKEELLDLGGGRVALLESDRG